MAANGAVAPSEAASTPPLGFPNSLPVVFPSQAVPQAPSAGYVAIYIPISTPVTVCPPPPPAGTDPHPNSNLAVLNPVVMPEVLNPVVIPEVSNSVVTPEVIMQACEVQINNLVNMQIKEGGNLSTDERKRLVAQEALKEWKEAERALQGKVERRTKQAGKLIFEVYQLVGLYSVFVGVVFTAALQSPFIKCQHIWSPVLLCVCAWLIIILVTRKRLIKYNALRATIKTEDESRSVTYFSSFPSNLKSRVLGFQGLIDRSSDFETTLLLVIAVPFHRIGFAYIVYIMESS